MLTTLYWMAVCPRASGQHELDLADLKTKQRGRNLGDFGKGWALLVSVIKIQSVHEIVKEGIIKKQYRELYKYQEIS